MGSFSDLLIDFLCDPGPSHLRFDSLVVELGGKDLTGNKLRCSVFQHPSSVTGKIAPKKVGELYLLISL